MPEQELIAKCRQGDRKAQQQLYKQYSGQLMAVAVRYAPTREDACDILQDAFVKAFRSLDSYRGDSPLFFWLKRIVVNTALNARRGKLYQQPMADVQQLTDLSGADTPLSLYKAGELMALLQRLPEGCRLIFNLYAIEGYKHREIADQLGISEGTSKSQFARARQLLQDMLAQEQEKVAEYAQVR